MEWVNVCLNSSLQQLRDANLKVAVTKFCHCFGDAQSSNKHCDNYRKKETMMKRMLGTTPRTTTSHPGKYSACSVTTLKCADMGTDHWERVS